MGAKVDANSEQITDCTFKFSFLTFGRITVSLPALSLLYCFLSAVRYQYDRVNKTDCNVNNYMPSISAVTGISPQCYVWRTCIGLHSMARIVIGLTIWNYYLNKLSNITRSQQGAFRKLALLSLLVYLVENVCLLLVANIGNTENYALHEKIFVVFMFASLIHEFLNNILFKWSHPDLQRNHKLSLSYKLKFLCFWLNMSLTGFLLFFFLRHRWYCEPVAFTWFSAAEYGIAYLNIGYHYTAAYELEELQWFLGKPAVTNNGHHHSNNNNNGINKNGYKKLN